MSNTANGRTVFVVGKELHGNRQVVVVENGQEYDLDPAAIVSYTSDVAQFPYTL
jgi:hypothetical protein